MTGEGPPTTAPSAPGGGAVVALFGDRLPLAERFAEHLATSAVLRGLIGPREVPRLWDRHLLNCAAVAELLAPGVRCVDVGSGAGLPGAVLAISRPDVEVILVEPLQRRVAWLEEVVADLGLGNVTVVRARAEELHRDGPAFDIAVARAVAPLDRLVGWCLPLVVPGGRLLALKGRSAGAELEASVGVLRGLGARSWEVVECGAEVLAEPTTVVVVEAGGDRSAGGATRRSRGRRAPGAQPGSGRGRRESGHASRGPGEP
ncbi:MAG: 16S rRNA (guanine(527)-N(7))-methyltransferase RsmG [Kineosporiaceae bacterium]